jgi:hypothetical protein
MTVHRDKLLVNETNRRTVFQFYSYYDSTCFGQPFCPSSGVLSRISALVHFMQFDDRLLPGAGCSILLPETCRVVIPIKLECSASVGFIHKEYLTDLNMLRDSFEEICQCSHFISFFRNK